MMSFRRPVASTARRNAGSSQALITVRSSSTLSLSTALSSGMVGCCPLATLIVDSTTGRSKVRASRATLTMLSTSSSRSIEVTVCTWLGW